MKGDTPDLYSLLLGASIFYAAYSIIQNITRRLVRSRFVKQHGCKVPARHPLKDPLFGIDGIRAAFRAIASKTFLEQVENQYKEYGNTFSSRRATFDIIYTVEPENIKTILSTKFEDYEVGSHRRRVFSPLLGNSVILLDGVRWEHTRTILRPSFTRSLMNDLPMLEEHISNLLQAIPRDGSTVNLAELFLRMTADVTTDFMFGESVNLLTNPEAFEKKWTAAFQDAMLGCEYRARLGQFASIVPQPKFFDAVKKVHAYMDEHVNKALQYRETLNAKELQGALDIESGAKKRYVFLHELSKLTGDRQTLRNELLTIFFAGRDSTSALLTNVFFLLARHPRVWRKLREEINQLNGARPTLADLKGLEYLGFCLNEALRLYPVIPGNSRISTKDTVLPKGGGDDGQSPVYVAAGTLVVYHIYALHRREDLWGADAAEFRPERWKDEKAAWKFLPFNNGPRNCMGQQFALTEAQYTTVRLLQEFTSIESRDEEPWREGLGSTCTSANGAKVALS